MIITNINGYDYRISFKHHNIGFSPKATTCFIEKVRTGGIFKTDGVLLANGDAVCHYCDNYNKSVGRKLAMKRAMISSDITRADRTKIWESYLGDRSLAVV